MTLSADGARRGAVRLTAELVAARTEYAGLVAACQAGLAAQEAGERDAWRWVAGAVVRAPRRLPHPDVLQRNKVLVAELNRVKHARVVLTVACWAGLRAGFDGDPDAWRHITDELDRLAARWAGDAHG